MKFNRFHFRAIFGVVPPHIPWCFKKKSYFFRDSQTSNIPSEDFFLTNEVQKGKEIGL